MPCALRMWLLRPATDCPLATVHMADKTLLVWRRSNADGSRRGGFDPGAEVGEVSFLG